MTIIRTVIVIIVVIINAAALFDKIYPLTYIYMLIILSEQPQKDKLLETASQQLLALSNIVRYMLTAKIHRATYQGP